MARQRHHYRTMFDNPLVQFAIELIRALAVDLLSARVRAKLRNLFRPEAHTSHGAFLSVHRRNRERLLNRLHTGEPDEE
jgi:hypothetical protein